jgi:molybdenum cofactor cytidylyltransferase
VCRKVIAAVILAAGSSTRLGHPKQLVVLGGESLIHRAVNIAVNAGLHPVIVVVNDAEFVEPLQAIGAQVVLNPRHSEGMATSIEAGVQRASQLNSSGVIVMACDQPALTADHLLQLAVEPDKISGSGYAGRTGIPAYFPSANFPALMSLEGDTGARNLLRGARTIEAEDLLLDIDTEADLNCARELYG